MPTTKNINGTIYQMAPDSAAVSLSNGDTLNLGQHGGLYAVGTGISMGVYSLEGHNTLNIGGGIYSANSYGMYSASGSNHLTVTSSGSILGGTGGVNFAGGFNTVTNHGIID